jgi:hypothetical protein
MRNWMNVDWSTATFTAQETRTRIQLADRDTAPVLSPVHGRGEFAQVNINRMIRNEK